MEDRQNVEKNSFKASNPKMFQKFIREVIFFEPYYETVLISNTGDQSGAIKKLSHFRKQ